MNAAAVRWRRHGAWPSSEPWVCSQGRIAQARWTGSLGPQHHGHDATTNTDVASLLPVELWWDTLSVLGRFFAGVGAHAYCRDFGDAPVYQLEAALDAPLADVEALVLRSRSLLLCDWPSNREVARIIQTLR